MDENDQTAYSEHSQKGCLPRILQPYHGYIKFGCPVPANTMVSTLSGGLHHIYAQRLRPEKVADGTTMDPRCHVQMHLGETYQNKRKSQS